MLYENSTQNRIKLTLTTNTCIDKKPRRHTISSYNQSDTKTSTATPNNMSESGLEHWKIIEKYYVNRLDSLQKEIDTAISQNAKLSLAREELVKEILELHQQSLELHARKEQILKSTHGNTDSHYPRGVTLEDKPYIPPTPPLNPSNDKTNPCISPTDISTSKTTVSPVIEQKETMIAPVINTASKTGILRQLSLRLSTRRKRKNDDHQVNNESSKKSDIKTIDNDIVPTVSTSEPLLHPAAVVNNGKKLSSLRRTSKKSMFGNDLVQQAKSENRKIPFIVTSCVQEIELRGITVEGIYRKSGTSNQLKQAQNEFKTKKGPDLSSYTDIHLIASLLKSYLRSLPTPLISNDFILPLTLTDQERLNKMYDLLRELPSEIYCTIEYLVQHLKRVHQNQAVNLMSSRNLAVVLGPTLMNISSVNEDSEQIIQTIELMILHSHILFANYY